MKGTIIDFIREEQGYIKVFCSSCFDSRKHNPHDDGCYRYVTIVGNYYLCTSCAKYIARSSFTDGVFDIKYNLLNQIKGLGKTALELISRIEIK